MSTDSRKVRLLGLRHAASLEQASDVDLLERIAGGSEEAFRMIWERYGAAVYSLCLRRLSDRQAAEDAAQEAFTNVWRRAVTFDARRGSAAGWLFAVARNAAVQVAHRGAPREGVPTVLDGEDVSHEDDIVARLAVHAALQRIPVAERTVLELAYFDDLSQSQIAARLRIPLGTVKTRTRSGLRRLARYFEETDL